MSALTYPSVPLYGFDTLWFQVAGTLCNLKCTHCFVSASPTNHNHEMLDLGTVKRYLAEALELGVKEYYFTGGEPFMNREIFEILEATLAQGPVSVLTNGLFLRPETCHRLRQLSDASPWSLDLRISIDGWDAATNDPVRGEGTFERILQGIVHLRGLWREPRSHRDRGLRRRRQLRRAHALPGLPARHRPQQAPAQGHAAASSRGRSGSARAPTPPGRACAAGPSRGPSPPPSCALPAAWSRRKAFSCARSSSICPRRAMGETLRETDRGVRPPAQRLLHLPRRGLSCRT